MLDPRVYRAGFLPLIAAIVVVMFSLQTAPQPLPEPVTPPAFEPGSAVRAARTIATLTPDRAPGSEGERRTADLIRERFASIEGAEVAVQEFEGSWEGEDVELRNVLVTLPGASEEVLLVVAPRDTATTPDASGSAAATGLLLELADSLGATRHERTIVLASTAGSPLGEAGIAELIEGLPAPEGITAAIAITDPGAPIAEQGPHVIAGRAQPDSVSGGLTATADRISTGAYGNDAFSEGPWSSLARLALPTGTGQAAALSLAGIEAIAISPAGERPPGNSSAAAEAASRQSISASGVAVAELINTLDEEDARPEHGPADLIYVDGSVLPGWSLALLALAIVLPAFLAAGDVWLRDRRRDPRTVRRSIPWALERALPPAVALLTVLVLDLVGLIPDPGFPYDPAGIEIGVRAALAFAAIVLATAFATLLIRPMRTPLDAEPQTLAAAAGLMCCIAVVGVWLLNPYLALLLAPATHVWLLAARTVGPPRLAVLGAAIALALIPVAAALLTVISALELGAGAPWHLLLLLASGQIGLLQGGLWCLLIGGLIAAVAATRAAPLVDPAPAGPRVLGPAGHRGPGSLGGTPSGLPGR